MRFTDGRELPKAAQKIASPYDPEARYRHMGERRAWCTRSQQRPRVLQRPAREQYEALRAAREWSRSEPGQQRYARRAGLEGTVSQGVRAYGLRRSRYRGLAKTHWQHVATAVAIKVDRIAAWLDGRPQAKTRGARFAALQPKAA